MRAREKYFLILLAVGIMATVAWGGSTPFVSWGPQESAAQAIGDMPKDIYPESGYRFPLVKREDLDDYGKTVYDKIFGAAGRSVAGARGPFGMEMNSPKVLDLQYQLTNYLRYDSGMNGAIRELAILTIAREMDNQFEWAAHEEVGLKEGLSQSIIDIVKYRRGVEGLSETETVIIQLGREMYGDKKVKSETFASALKIFGKKQLVEVVVLMGIYAQTAGLLNAFDMQLNEHQKKFVLPPR